MYWNTDKPFLQRNRRNRKPEPVELFHPPVLPFPCFFWKKREENHQKKQGFFYPHRTPKIPGKEGKNAQKNKEFLAREKNKEIPKKQGKEGQGPQNRNRTEPKPGAHSVNSRILTAPESDPLESGEGNCPKLLPLHLNLSSGLSKRCFCQTVILSGWHPPFSSFLSTSWVGGANPWFFVGRMQYQNFRRFSSKPPVFGRGQNDRFPKRPFRQPWLVAFQTQTQNRRVLATQFPKSHPCPRWQL